MSNEKKSTPQPDLNNGDCVCGTDTVGAQMNDTVSEIIKACDVIIEGNKSTPLPLYETYSNLLK